LNEVVKNVRELKHEFKVNNLSEAFIKKLKAVQWFVVELKHELKEKHAQFCGINEN